MEEDEEEVEDESPEIEQSPATGVTGSFVGTDDSYMASNRSNQVDNMRTGQEMEGMMNHPHNNHMVTAGHLY